MSDVIPQGMQEVMAESGVQMDTHEAMEAFVPMYKVDAVTKIPVSKKMGSLIKSRIDSGLQARKFHADLWDECLRYYNNAQQDHRSSKVNMAGNRYYAARKNNAMAETENIIYANVRATIPALYAKNPTSEFTSYNEETKDYVQTLEDLVNTLAPIPDAPGLNLRIHAKQAVTCTEICNISWIEYGYLTREKSPEQAEQEMMNLSHELEEAKDEKEIREIEGQIAALEAEIDIITPAGPFIKYRPAQSVVIDPVASMPDASDASWMAVEELWPTEYLNAKYGEKDESGRIMSIYEPTAVLASNAKSENDETALMSLTSSPNEPAQYGHSSQESLKKAYRTKCWRFFDKTTRRVYLFADNKWDWPIWVENDPYGLPGFFPLVPLVFNTTPMSLYAKSNTAYYLDQQDALNEIHDEFRRERKSAKDNVLYDNRLSKDTVEKWLIGGDQPTANGVDVPEGMELKSMVLEKPSVIARMQHLFDTQRIYASIDRLSGVSDVMRGVQFKTNTTNKAVESYNSSTATRLDEKIDAIEHFLGKVFFGVAYLCAQFMPKEQVEALLGKERAANWTNYTAKELRHMFQCQVIGGSTQKPTSEAKKVQALQLADILAKQAQFAPTTTITLILQLLSDAYDEMTLPPNAFEQVAEEVQLSMQRGNSVQGGAGGGDAVNQGPESSSPAGTSVEELIVAVDSLPSQAKLALGDLLSRGVPVVEALPEVLRAAQQSGNEGV